MNSSPDFSSYSLSELLEAQQGIDKEAYPERVQEIESLLFQKKNDPAVMAELARQEELEKYSTFFPRLWASILDAIVLSLLSALLVFLGNQTGGLMQTAINHSDMVQFAVYSLALHTLYGQTLGKMALGIKVVDYRSEGEISFRQALLRDIVPVAVVLFTLLAAVYVALTGGDAPAPQWLLYTLGIFSLLYLLWYLLEIITMLFNEKRRALHDIIAGTVVIRL